jgi:hypothetical protein
MRANLSRVTCGVSPGARQAGHGFKGSPFSGHVTMFTPVIVTRGSRAAAFMDLDDVAHLAEALTGVRRTAREGLAEWRYHGRLVARQLDDMHVAIRADFDFRDSILRQFPGTFSVPTRYIKHMMVVADLAGGNAGAIEDALEAAWQLQRSAD